VTNCGSIEPAWEQGVSGRDIDYIIVSELRILSEIVKNIEKYLDDLVGYAITNYFAKKGKFYCSEPFNKIIKHNLIEIHAIQPHEKKKIQFKWIVIFSTSREN